MSDFLACVRTCQKPRSQCREPILCELGTVRDQRRFTTVRLAETFQRLAHVGVYCVGFRTIRDQRWFTTTRHTLTSHRSGFGVEESVRLGPAASSNRHDGGFLIRLRCRLLRFRCRAPAERGSVTGGGDAAPCFCTCRKPAGGGEHSFTYRGGGCARRRGSAWGPIPFSP